MYWFCIVWYYVLLVLVWYLGAAIPQSVPGLVVIPTSKAKLDELVNTAAATLHPVVIVSQSGRTEDI